VQSNDYDPKRELQIVAGLTYLLVSFACIFSCVLIATIPGWPNLQDWSQYHPKYQAVAAVILSLLSSSLFAIKLWRENERNRLWLVGIVFVVHLAGFSLVAWISSPIQNVSPDFRIEFYVSLLWPIAIATVQGIILRLKPWAITLHAILTTALWGIVYFFTVAMIVDGP
jgi:RsiW-degrading membrane proteinase PrsW (M82 family)